MAKLWTWLVAGLLACAPAAGVGQSNVDSTPPAPPASGSLEDYIDGLAISQMETLSIPGIAVAVVVPGKEPILRAYGVGSGPGGEPVPIDARNTIMPIASISKTFIGVAMMRAVEQGKLSLDAPANRYLDFKLPRYKGARDITLRDLARHEAGFEERWLATGAGGTKPDPRPWGQIMAQTAPKLIAPPGAYASYSNYGAALLAYIVQRATGVPYETYLERQVFAPLGMTSSGIRDPLPPRLAARELVGWSVSGGVPQPEQHFYNTRSSASGRVRASLPDLVRYMRMLMAGGMTEDGKQFLTPQSVKTLLIPSKRLDPEMPTMATLFAEKDIGTMRFVGHGGDGGSRHTDMLINPNRGVAIFIDYFSAPGAHTRDQFSRALVGRLFPETRAPLLPVPESATRDLSEFAGAYRHYRWAQTSVERLLQLTSEFAVADSGRGTLIVTGRLGPGEYVPTAKPNLFRNRTTGEALYLRHDEDGRPLLNHGSYPFVTAYKLDTVDTQAFTHTAFWFFIIGLTIMGVAILIAAFKLTRSAVWRAGTAFAVLGATLTVCGIGLYRFLGAAAAISEPDLQHAIPDAAYWYLGIPVAAAIIVVVFVAGWINRLFRAHRLGADTLAWIGIALFAGFVAFLVHWNAFGWSFPESGVV